MLKELLNYTQKADEIMLNSYQDFGFNLPEANTLFSHILCAQHIWACRILNQKPQLGVWEQIDPTQFSILFKENFEKLFKILDTVSLSLTVNYTNSKAEIFKNTVEEIIIHLCNHGTYHRGRLASYLRRAGGEPPITDYVILKRESLI